MKLIISCGLCDGEALLQSDTQSFNYKGETFNNIQQYFYKCNSCSEEFTTDEVDDLTLKQVHREYWKTHVDEGVLFDNVISDLDKQKTLAEYKYMMEHKYIYTEEQQKLIIDNFDVNKFPELKELYNEWITKN
jgi:hypothetical protein